MAKVYYNGAMYTNAVGSIMRYFKLWLKNSSIKDRRLFAAKSGISLTYLRELMKKRRQASAGVASAMEKAARDMGLPPLTREQLCDACRRCDLAKKARRL